MISVVSACIGRVEITQQFIDTTLRNCSEPQEFVLVSNGSTSAENATLRDALGGLAGKGWQTTLVVTSKPLGTSGAFNSGVQAADHEVVVVLQNDLLVLQSGWNLVVADFFANHPEAGVVGFAGGKGIGDADIYQIPYELHQLARNNVYTSLDEWWAHGAACVKPEPVVVLDGIAMAMLKADWKAWGGYDETMTHHLYDIDLSLTAHYADRTNYVIPVLCKHLSGQTVNHSKAYADWVAPRGGDEGVHRESHEYIYNKWRGKLPVSV